MTKPPLLPIGLREDSRTRGHTQVSVFIGRNEGARGRSGAITIRNDEWKDLQEMIERGLQLDREHYAMGGVLHEIVEVMDPVIQTASMFDLTMEGDPT